MGGAVAAIILNNKEEILFTVRAKDPGKGTLDLPGGFIDLHERAEDAVIREIKEELDLDISELTYFTSFPNHYVYKDFSYFTIDLCFICKVNSFKDIKSLDDVVDFKFIPLEEINTEDIGLASIRKMLTMYKEQKQTLKA
jgi:ADP-ribose pyrophosphatase YjhB (NUDIX family)